jgi:hypothetical protein
MRKGVTVAVAMVLAVTACSGNGPQHPYRPRRPHASMAEPMVGTLVITR